MSNATRFTRYGIRSLLILTTAIAIVLGIARLRPSPVIVLDVSAAGSVAIAGRPIAPEAMQKRLEAELARRRRWWVDGSVVIHADPQAGFQSLSSVIESAQLAGCSQVAISAKNRQ